MTLDVAAEGAGETDQEHGGGEGEDAAADRRLGDEENCHLRGIDEHHGGQHQADACQRTEGDVEDPPHLARPVQGVGLGDHAAQGHGQTGGGDSEQNIINRVGGIEVSIPRVPQHVGERDLVNGAQNLHDNDTGGEDRRSIHIVLPVCV